MVAWLQRFPGPDSIQRQEAFQLCIGIRHSLCQRDSRIAGPNLLNLDAQRRHRIRRRPVNIVERVDRCGEFGLVVCSRLLRGMNEAVDGAVAPADKRDAELPLICRCDGKCGIAAIDLCPLWGTSPLARRR